MNGKGDKWRGGWTPQYAENHNKIFGGKMNEEVPAKMYLEMWLSEQITPGEWIDILKENTEVNNYYQNYMTAKKRQEKAEEEYENNNNDDENN